jgi:mannose-6-phosphate isomerase
MSKVVEDGVGRLLGTIQHYAWGGHDFIPNLIGLPSESGMLYAEYWLGAHDTASSRMLHNNGTTRALNDVIRERPARTLGPSVARRYGRLPFLLKVLDVREMLSIQVHPAKTAAAAGFARENELGIPLHAPKRNYRDDNHKPELEVALSDFWLLHGFRRVEQMRGILSQVPEFHSLRPIFERGGYFGLYKHVMEMPQQVVNTLLSTLLERILPKFAAGALVESSPDYWAAKAVQGKQVEEYDRGIFSIYFFNLVRLKQGQATFQGAGIPHAYLQGQAIEIMANSDNVIRGGLTPKHVDVPELLRLIRCEGGFPEIIEGRSRGNPREACYVSPAHDFCLSKIHLNPGDRYEHTASSIEILLAHSGEATLDSDEEQMPLKKGESLVVFVGTHYRMTALSEHTLLFRASVPIGGVDPRS